MGRSSSVRLVLFTMVVVAGLLAGCSGAPPATDTEPTTAATETTQPAGFDAPAYAAAVYHVTVVEVVDGDTIDVRYRNGSLDTVRLLGVDTPETYGSVSPDEFEGVPDTDAGRACLRAEARDAKQYLRERLAGERVVLVLDRQADRRGSYGRLLAMVFQDGVNVNERLVVEGYARVYTSGFSIQAAFLAAENEAQRANRGLWRCQNVDATTTVATDGGSTGALVVASIHADADGNDHENLNGEYVVFENTGDTALDLGGWTVSDSAGHTFTFPTGFTLDPGATVTLHTGSGQNTDTELYWGADGAVWNNGGDTVRVTTPTGDVVLRYEYGN